MSYIRQFSVLAVSLIGLAFFVPGPGPAHAATASVASTTWKVEASWSPDHPFFWVFDTHGGYKDTDGPKGTWKQDSNSLTLRSNGGFEYRATVSGETASGHVYLIKSGKDYGTFNATQVVTK